MNSATKTPNYQLPQWQGSDKPDRADFNTALSQIDTALANKVNPNILHNWYYPNPVNQRGVSGTISTAGYFIDRWRLINGTVALTSNGLILNGTIIQILEHAVGTNVTASVKMHNGTATASYDNTTKTFTITSSGGTIAAAKLEVGSVSTLAADPPQDYGVELAKCQRYCFVMSGTSPVFRAASIYSNGFYFTIPTPVTLRVNPAVTGAVAINTIGGSSVSGDPFEVSYMRIGNGLWITATKTAHGMTDAALRIPVNTIFSADL